MTQENAPIEADDAPNTAMAALTIDGLEGPLGQRIYHALRSNILDMSFPPGLILRKGALCDQLGVSRSPVAEALGRLSSDGLVDIVPQSATRVSQFSLTELREESFLRDAIEVAAVAKVAREHSDEQIVKLARNLRLQALLLEDHDFTGLFEADEEFHSLILAFTGYSKVALAAGQMSLQIHRARILMLPEPGRCAETVVEHAAILDAIKSRDPHAAQKAMSEHLSQLITRILPLEKQYPTYFRSS